MKVNVKGQTYIIIEEELANAHGECNTDSFEIKIDNSDKTKGRLRRITLAHELLHAYLNEMYVTDIISDDLEEILCEIVGHMVDKHLQMFIDFE
jgi:hypothetical protein